MDRNNMTHVNLLDAEVSIATPAARNTVFAVFGAGNNAIDLFPGTK
jgi:hypothetical protein